MMTREKFEFLKKHLGERRAHKLKEEFESKGKAEETMGLAEAFKSGLDHVGEGDEELAELLGEFREALDSQDPVDAYVQDLLGGRVVKG